MATTNKKKYWYVLVFTDAGPVFVTSLNNADRTAYWNKDEKPKSVSMQDAEFLAVALTWNGNYSLAVRTTYELDNQPYHYARGHFEWHWNEKVDK